MFVLGLGPAEHGERSWVFRGVLGVLGVVVCSRVSGACWVVAVMRKFVVDSANVYSRHRTPRMFIRAVGLREYLFAP